MKASLSFGFRTRIFYITTCALLINAKSCKLRLTGFPRKLCFHRKCVEFTLHSLARLHLLTISFRNRYGPDGFVSRVFRVLYHALDFLFSEQFFRQFLAFVVELRLQVLVSVFPAYISQEFSYPNPAAVLCAHLVVNQRIQEVLHVPLSNFPEILVHNFQERLERINILQSLDNSYSFYLVFPEKMQHFFPVVFARLPIAYRTSLPQQLPFCVVYVPFAVKLRRSLLGQWTVGDSNPQHKSLYVYVLRGVRVSWSNTVRRLLPPDLLKDCSVKFL